MNQPEFFLNFQEVDKMTFKPGKSGNPSGKPKGTLHKATRAALEILEGDLEAITRVCIDKAKAGDLLAVKLILDKLLPNRRERSVNLKLPRVKAVQDLPKALEAVMQAVAAGELTPGEGQALTTMLTAFGKGLELFDIEARLTALEEQAGHGKT
jgi:hypothetical protein